MQTAEGEWEGGVEGEAEKVVEGEGLRQSGRAGESGAPASASSVNVIERM